MSDTPRTLVEWLLIRFPNTPRTRAKQWIEAGRVRVDGKIVHKANTSYADPNIRIELLPRGQVAIQCDPPWEIHPKLILLHLDSSLAVVNKAAGLLSVPAGDQRISALSILVDFLAGRLRTRNSDDMPHVLRRLHPLPVHRLDQFTSGLLCFAMNPKSRSKLIEEVTHGQFTREYVAYVDGQPKPPRGTWRHRLQLSPDQWDQRVESSSRDRKQGGKTADAVTHYETERVFTFSGSTRVITKLKVRLETGLRHQIRVQAAQEKMPIIGDRSYHPLYRDAELLGSHPVPAVDRQALHATRLELPDPEREGQRLSWTAPLPRDLRMLEETLARAKR